LIFLMAAAQHSLRPHNTAAAAAARAGQTPPGFRFHFKAFCFFASRTAPAGALPREVREALPPSLLAGGGQIGPGELPPGGEDALWRLFHEALAPVVAARRMGLVVFQFHFKPSEANRAHVLDCRRRLNPGLGMAAEFRDRAWFTAGPPGGEERLGSWLAAHGIVAVAADELAHETAQRDREQRGLPPGEARAVLPILGAPGCASAAYVRLHRRHGTLERLLPEGELRAWAARIEALRARRVLRGPIYFLWGTDHEDAPIVNARRLAALLPPGAVHDQRAALRARAPLAAFFGKATAGPKAAGAAAGAAAASAASPSAPSPSGGKAPGAGPQQRDQPRTREQQQDKGQQQQQQGEPAAKRQKVAAGGGRTAGRGGGASGRGGIAAFFGPRASKKES
jgi:uncharacterized protein YecE (DUF72 family)